MANTLVQFRTEETARIKAVGICEKLGIDLRCFAEHMFLNTL